MTVQNNSELVSFTEVFGFLRRRIALIAIGCAIGAALGFLGSGYMPMKYKSKAILSIQSGYFHHPLISDVVAEIQDTAEMSSQRLALIRLALNDEFLESFGRTYFPKKGASPHVTKPLEPELLLKHIEYFPTNPTSFQISVTTSSPQMAVSAANDIVTQIMATLEKQRHLHLHRTYESLVRHATNLQNALSHGSSAPNRDSIQSRIGALQAKLATLRESLSDTHPDVISVKRELSVLTSRLDKKPVAQVTSESTVENVFLFSQSRDTTLDIVDDLLKKISHLTIVLHTLPEPNHCSFVDIIERPRLPKWHFSPIRAQIILIGAAAGLVLALIIAVACELREKSGIKPTEASAFLEVLLLGELPELPTVTNTPSPVIRTLVIETLLFVLGTGINHGG